MNFSNIEEKIVAPFYRYIHLNKVNVNDIYLIKWSGGTQILAKYDTCYESDNNLELDDPNYEDFISIIVRVKKLKAFTPLDGFKKEWLKEGVLFEFSYHDFPDEIYNSKGELISKRED